jgi:hypothetical protein
MVGSAVLRIVLSRLITIRLRHSTPSVHQRRGSGGAEVEGMRGRLLAVIETNRIRFVLKMSANVLLSNALRNRSVSKSSEGMTNRRAARERSVPSVAPRDEEMQ